MKYPFPTEKMFLGLSAFNKSETVEIDTYWKSLNFLNITNIIIRIIINNN